MARPDARAPRPSAPEPSGGGRARALAALTRGDALGWAVVALASLTVAWPLLSCAHLPFVDYPQHLGMVAALHGADDPAFSPYFYVDLGRGQYLLFTLVAHLLAFPFGVELGARLTLVLGIATLPLAVAALARAHARPVMPAALCALAALHVFVFWGFVHYAIGVTVAILGVAAHARLVASPTRGRVLVFAGVALLSYLAHGQTYVWMACACVLQAIALAPTVGASRTLRAGLAAALGAIPSVAAMLAWLHRSTVLEQGVAADRSGHGAAIAETQAAFEAPEQALRAVFDRSFAVYRDGSGDTIALLFAAGLLLLVISRGMGPRRRESADQPSARVRSLAGSFAPEALVLSALAGYFFAPVSYKLIEPISHRFLPVALALLPLLGPTTRLGRPARALIAAFLAASTLYAASVHVERFALLDEEMGDLDGALSHTRPGRRLLGLIYDKQSQVVPFVTYLHAHQYYQARVGGVAEFGFVEFPVSVIRWRDGAAPEPFPPRFEWTPERFDHRRWGAYFEYYLVRTAPGRPAPAFFPPGAPDAPRLVFDSPRWKLFARE